MSSSSTDAGDVLPLGPEARRSPVNWRTVLFGLVGVVVICAVTPFNDYVVNNSPLVGNYLPPGVMLFLVAFLLLVNGPLHRWAPSLAFSGAEIAVILGMILVSAGLPGSALMRYLPAHLIGIWHYGGMEANVRELLEALRLPNWVFPTMESADPTARSHDPVISHFWNRVPLDSPTFWNYFEAVPWRAWLTPALTWGALLIGMWVTVLCLVVLLYRQWAENERLPFPLASVYVSLIEPPERGRMFNGLFRARSFWIAVAMVLFVHTLNGLNKYDAKHWPEMPLTYDFNSLFADRPWFFMDLWVKKATIFFSVIGICYFVQTSLLFSIWFFVVALQVYKMTYGSMGGDWSEHSNIDQMFGGMVPFALGILWIGRHHWMLVMRQMVRGPRGGEMRGRYMPYPAAGWGLVAGMSVVIGWLWLAGCTLGGAVFIVLLMLMLMIVAMRMVAETGLLYVQTRIPLQQPFLYMLQDLPATLATRPKLETFYFAGLFSNVFTLDQREAVPVFASHTLRVADLEADPRGPSRQRPFMLVLCLFLSLVVGYVVSGASTLYFEYRYAATLDRSNTAPINSSVHTYTNRTLLLTRTWQMIPPGEGRPDAHNRLGHFTFGAVLTTALIVLRLRFVAWPLHPIGFLIVYTNPGAVMWFSIGIGWVLKVVLVRFGGSQVYRSARPFFMGLIIGEAMAAAIWLVVSLVRLSMALQYEPISLLPK